MKHLRIAQARAHRESSALANNLAEIVEMKSECRNGWNLCKLASSHWKVAISKVRWQGRHNFYYYDYHHHLCQGVCIYINIHWDREDRNVVYSMDRYCFIYNRLSMEMEVDSVPCRQNRLYVASSSYPLAIPFHNLLIK